MLREGRQGAAAIMTMILTLQTHHSIFIAAQYFAKFNTKSQYMVDLSNMFSQKAHVHDRSWALIIIMSRKTPPSVRKYFRLLHALTER